MSNFNIVSFFQPYYEGKVMTIIISAVVIVLATILGFGAHYFSKENDSSAEQLAESLLKKEGVDIDFSADSKPE